MTPENVLEQVLIAAATEPDARPTFYRLMLDSVLYTINDAPDAGEHEGSRTLAPGTKLMLPNIDFQGAAHTPLFSSLSRLQAVVTSERRYVAMQGRALLEIIRGAPAYLNPGSPYGKQFTAPEIESMLDGSIFRGYATQVVQQPTRVLLGQPAEYPRHLTDALAKVMAALPSIRAAYLAQCVFPESSERPQTMIGVDSHDPWESVIDPIMATIRRVARKDELVNVLRIDETGVSKYMLETRPFYARNHRLP